LCESPEYAISITYVEQTMVLARAWENIHQYADCVCKHIPVIQTVKILVNLHKYFVNYSIYET